MHSNIYANQVHGRRNFLSRWGALSDFSRGSHKDFSQGGQKMAKFNFSFAKLGKRSFFAKNATAKGQISKSRGSVGPLPPSEAHDQVFSKENSNTQSYLFLLFAAIFAIT